MQPMLNIAVRAARSAGDIIARAMDRLDTLTVTTKSRNSFVSEVDKMAEAEIIAILRKAYPDHAILAEESGEQAGDDYQWIIDPLDGTTNFLFGFPQFAVSIALRHKGRLEQAVIYDPVRDELFTASRGSGAQLNGRRIRVSNRHKLEDSLIGTGFPYADMRYLDPYMDMLKTVIPRTAGVRRAGAASLDLAYVAAGRLDGFWEFGLSPWDIAAGVLLIEEAGGLVSDFSGGQSFMDTGHIVAGNPRLFKVLLQTLQPALPAALK
ncbi:MAG TPA: inositol-1-monophosphatase [Gammaproteobacteria bacterium]|nr:inositol-1-monophosphatase [Gammaproteobacteria bacterium]